MGGEGDFSLSFYGVVTLAASFDPCQTILVLFYTLERNLLPLVRNYIFITMGSKDFPYTTTYLSLKTPLSNYKLLLFPILLGLNPMGFTLT